MNDIDSVRRLAIVNAGLIGGLNMARVITEVVDYPNMTPQEIVKSGVALSGDALDKFIRESSEDIVSEFEETAREEARDAIDEAIMRLQGARDDI